MSRAAPRRLALSIERLRDELAPAGDLARIQMVWEDAVGPAIAVQARPVALIEGTLVLDCSSSVWASELTMMAAELCERVTEALCVGEFGAQRSAVERLRCRAR
ncbi:MAG: DUF721 domain-containing protein [Solirubrobacteraceae bacterium]